MGKMLIDIDNVKNEYGETPRDIAKEIGEALANKESFILYCYWAEFVKGRYLGEMYYTLDNYLHSGEWDEYYREHNKENLS